MASDTVGRDPSVRVIAACAGLAELLQQWRRRGGVATSADEDELAGLLVSFDAEFGEIAQGVPNPETVGGKLDDDNSLGAVPGWFWMRLPQRSRYFSADRIEFRRHYLHVQASPRTTELVVVGGYRLHRFLAFGGMGVVLEATGTRGKLRSKPVALKLIRRDQHDVETIRRFRRETRLMQMLDDRARTQQSNIRILDSGEGKDSLFLVMELVTGPSLADLLGTRACQRLPVPLVADLGTQVARGLALAHSNPDLCITHRDLKPGNVMLESIKPSSFHPNGWHARVADCGLALPSVGSSITKKGYIVGRRRYQSPEQLDDGAEIGPPSDIFSLGIMLYEMLAGLHPFEKRQHTSGKSSYDPHVVILSAPRSHNRSVPTPLSQRVVRMITKTANRRPSADSILEELPAFLKVDPGDQTHIRRAR